jgi:hypothetical protein
MSWIEQVNKSFEITTGDGKKYTPEWINANKAVEFNVKEFNFPGVSGTLVDRRKPKGSKYELEIFFQGDDHLDLAAAFEVSASDERFWKIAHPLYGLINVQPNSLLFDNSQNNVTKIIGTVTETITETNPKALVIPEDKIDEDVEVVNEQMSVSFENNVTPTSSDLNTAKADNEKAFATVDPKIENDFDGQEYFNSFNDAQNALTEGFADAGAAIRKTQSFIEAPARFSQSVKSRISLLGDNLSDLRKNVLGTATTISKNTKKFYEVQAGATLAAMALASSIVFDENDYDNRPKVVEVIDTLLLAFAEYLSDLDNMQLGSGGDPNDYVATAETIIQINNLLNFTMSNLFLIGLSARQERFYVTPDKTDLISLAHKLYGLADGDESIEELIRNNGFGIKHFLEVAKDITVKYYI